MTQTPTFLDVKLENSQLKAEIERLRNQLAPTITTVIHWDQMLCDAHRVPLESKLLIARDEAREAAREILAYFANRESDVWVKITTKYPWLEEE